MNKTVVEHLDRLFDCVPQQYRGRAVRPYVLVRDHIEGVTRPALTEKEIENALRASTQCGPTLLTVGGRKLTSFVEVKSATSAIMELLGDQSDDNATEQPDSQAEQNSSSTVRLDGIEYSIESVEMFSPEPDSTTDQKDPAMAFVDAVAHLINDKRFPQSTEVPDGFVSAFKMMQGLIHICAVSHGWWENDRNDGEMIALMHSELSEALEAIRAGNPPDDKCPEFNGAVVEFADVIIRIMDMCEQRGWPLAEALLAKYQINVNRPYKHGGKAF